MDPEKRMVPAKDIKPGDMVDLAGDKYADPKGDKIVFECEYGIVAEVERETADCVVLYIEGVDGFGFPVDHLIAVHGHDDAYDEDED